MNFFQEKIEMNLDDKLSQLESKIAEKEKILVAFSGGVDSSITIK
jgi:PP-loop superfamily ATP-utilizing enzyme